MSSKTSVFNIKDAYKKTKDTLSNFPTVSFIVFVIFAISTYLLMAYVINAYNSYNTTNKMIVWGLFISSIVVFIFGRLLYFFDFEYKNMTLIVMMVIEATLGAASLFAASNFAQGANDMTYENMYYVSQSMNILTTVLGIVPLMYI